jgi:hypothetical protein
MGRTCDECKWYSIASGVCCKFTIMRHSCGEDACLDFELAADLAEMEARGEL